MFAQVKQEIDNTIKTNGNNEITATRLNDVLQDMMDAAAEEIENVAESVGDQVEANPAGEATTTLNKIKIGETTYKTDNPFVGKVQATDAQRLQALANVSNQEAGYDESDPLVFTGKMGYKVLQPYDPSVDGSQTFAQQIAGCPNTIFEIRDVFDLGDPNGENPTTIPANCTLKFNGGMLKNGTLNGNNTSIDADAVKIFDSTIDFSGTWNVDRFNLAHYGLKANEYNNSVDSTNALVIKKAIVAFGSVYIPDGLYYVECGRSVSSSSWGSIGIIIRNTERASGIDIELSENAILKGSPNTPLTTESNPSYCVLSFAGSLDGSDPTNPIINYIDGIKIHGGKIVGVRELANVAQGASTYENYSAVWIVYSKNIEFKNIEITDGLGDGVYTGGVEHITFDSCVFLRNRRSAIGVGLNDTTTIKNCIFIKNNCHVVYDESHETYETLRSNISLEAEPRVLYRSNGGGGSLLEYPYVNHNIKDVLVENCKFDCIESAQALGGTGDVIFRNNSVTCERPYYGALWNSNNITYPQTTTHNVVIEDNVIEITRVIGSSMSSYAFQTTGDNFVARNNKIINSSIALGDGKSVLIEGNYIDFSFCCMPSYSNENQKTGMLTFRNNITTAKRFGGTGYFGFLIENNTFLASNEASYQYDVYSFIGTQNSASDTSWPIAQILNNTIKSDIGTLTRMVGNYGRTPIIKGNIFHSTGSGFNLGYVTGEAGTYRVQNGIVESNVFSCDGSKVYLVDNDTYDRYLVLRNNIFKGYTREYYKGDSESVYAYGNIYPDIPNFSNQGGVAPSVSSLRKGYSFYDINSKKTKVSNGSLWLDSDGVAIKDGIGTTAARPDVSTLKYSGYQYYNTDTGIIEISNYVADPEALTWSNATGDYKAFGDTEIIPASALPSNNLLLPNVYYNIGIVVDDFSVGIDADDSYIVREYDLVFGTVNAIQVTWLGNWNWFDGTEPTIEANKIYHIKVVNGFAYCELGSLTTSTGGELCFTAVEANSTVKLQKVENNNTAPDISLEYSTDGKNWAAYSFTDKEGDLITLPNVFSRVFFRSTSDTYKALASTYNDRYHKFVMTGKIAASGDLTSLLKKTGNVLELGSYALKSVFDGCSSLVTAPSIPSTSIATSASGVLRESFRNCTNLKKAPELFIETLKSDAYLSMFSGCSKLNYIKTHMTTISALNCLTGWVQNVQTTQGTFVCDENLEINRGANGIPTNWTRYNLDGTLWVDPNA